MDNNGIYEYAFYNMYNSMKKSKEDFSKAQEVMRELYRPILFTKDDNAELYDAVVSGSEHSIIVEMEMLIMRLFENNSVDFIPFQEDEAKYYLYMPFYRIEENKKVAYVFHSSLGSPVDWKGITKKYSMDRIVVVSLVETLPSKQAGQLKDPGQLLSWIVNQAEAKSGGIVQYITLADLFDFLGEGEYDNYLSHVKKYNENVRKLIGYSTVTIPSEDAMERFKKDRLQMLLSYDYSSACAPLPTNDVSIIENNFFHRELVRAVVGDLPFAESFLSAEWYYQMHIATSALEQTAIVVGYLKSIEQLLFTLVTLPSQTIPANTSFADYTLGQFEFYINTHQALWETHGLQPTRFIVNKLICYRENYRNGHLHKTNVFQPEEIDNIRDQTIQLYFLLLGALRIQDSDISYLKLWEEKFPIKVELTYHSFSEWLDRILNGDTLLETDRLVYLNLGWYGKEQCQLSFVTVEKFEISGENNQYHLPVNEQYPYINDCLLWDNDSTETDSSWDKELEEVKVEKKIGELINQYYKTSLSANKLKKYDVYYGFFGHSHKADHN